MIVMDSVIRLLPGVLGNKDSAVTDSFSTGLLEHPHYTRPADFRGMKVPDILLSGNHAWIEEWRDKESLKKNLRTPPRFTKKLSLDRQAKNLAQRMV